MSRAAPTAAARDPWPAAQPNIDRRIRRDTRDRTHPPRRRLARNSLREPSPAIERELRTEPRLRQRKRAPNLLLASLESPDSCVLSANLRANPSRGKRGWGSDSFLS